MSKGRILIVDDQEFIRITLSDFLHLEGYEVATEPNGELALERVQRESFDVMILDIRMPGMNGVEVLRRVFERIPDLRVILITAHASMDTAIEAIHYGVFDYLEKPVKFQDVRQAVQRALLAKQTASIAEAPARIQTGIYRLQSQVVIDCNKRVIAWDGQEIGLTPSEGRLLDIFLSRPGEVVSHEELVRLIQGYQVDGEEAAKIMRPVISRLRQKVAEIPGGGDWIRNVRGSGYLLEVALDDNF